MTTWTELLDSYRDRIATLERFLDRDRFEEAPGAFTPPPTAPDEAPTADERAAFETLQQRAAGVRQRLQQALDASQAEIGSNRRRAAAARAYHRNG